MQQHESTWHKQLLHTLYHKVPLLLLISSICPYNYAQFIYKPNSLDLYLPGTHGDIQDMARCYYGSTKTTEVKCWRSDFGPSWEMILKD